MKHNLLGQRFGRLVVAGEAPTKYMGKNREPKPCWRCICDCGNELTTQAALLKRGDTKSCGCLKKERVLPLRITHGHARGQFTPEYRTWTGAKWRCNNPDNPQWHNYGGRGITMCERWANSFQAFFEDMGARPPNHSLERKDNGKGYSPDNCVWATQAEQTRNRRVNIAVTYEGRYFPTLYDLARFLHLSYGQLYYLHRTKGLPISQAVAGCTPP